MFGYSNISQILYTGNGMSNDVPVVFAEQAQCTMIRLVHHKGSSTAFKSALHPRLCSRLSQDMLTFLLLERERR